MRRLSFTVVGTPAPQGSKRHVGNGIMVESSKKVRPWRQDVKYAAIDAMHHAGLTQPAGAVDHVDPLDGPVAIEVTFVLARPKGHHRTGRNAHLLRDSAPARPAGKPDIDKLLRSTLDALGEAKVWRDDAQVVDVRAFKVYESYLHGRPGARITITTLPGTVALDVAS